MGKGVIFKIDDVTEKFPNIGMRVWLYMIGSRGMIDIVNVRYENADYPNMFRFLKNITKK